MVSLTDKVGFWSGRRGLFCLLIATFASAWMWAQDEFTRPETTGEPDLVPSRKLPSVFHRPSRATPAEQLAYAEELRSAGKLRKAARAFDAVVHTWSGSEEAVRAQMRLAETLEERGRYEQAFREYQYLIENYAGRFPHTDILERQFQIAKRLTTHRFGKFLFFRGYTAPERALPMLEAIIRNGPRWDRAAEAHFLIATLHEEAGSFEEAAEAYDRILYRYPKSAFVVDASFQKAMCEYRIAQKNRRDESSCRTALSSLAAFVRSYPDDRRVESVQARMEELNTHLAQMYYERALFYDRMGKRPTSALIAYREFLRLFPSSPMAARARQRVTELKNMLGEQGE